MSGPATAATLKRCGLFGGTFDPVHHGHLAVAQAALTQLGLDQLWWLPAGAPWQKAKPAAASHHRVAMLRLAIEGQGRCAVDERELHREGPTYTIDTLESLALDHPGVAWFLVIGQDQLARLPTWHRWQEVARRVVLAVVARDGQTPVPSADVAAAGARVMVLQMPPVATSSTDIRHRLGLHQSVDSLVPEPVARYIDRHHLYR